MSSIALRSFRDDLIHTFPDVPALRNLPDRSPGDQFLLMSKIAQSWDTANVPKLYPLPWSVAIRRKIAHPVRQLTRSFNAISKVVEAMASVAHEGKKPVLAGPDGQASGSGTGGKPPEYTVRQVKQDAADDPYSAENRFLREARDRLALIHDDPKANERFNAILTAVEQVGPIRDYQDAHQRVAVVVNKPQFYIDARQQTIVQTEPEKKQKSWAFIGTVVALIVCATGFAADALDVVEKVKPYVSPSISAETAPIPTSESNDPVSILEIFDGSPLDIIAADTKKGLRIRKGPSTETKQIGSLMEGDVGTVIAVLGDWAKIHYIGVGGDTAEGWIEISGNHLQERR